MTHQPANAEEREYALDLFYREIANVEQAVTEAEQREQRMNAATQDARNERFPSLDAAKRGPVF